MRIQYAWFTIEATLLLYASYLIRPPNIVKMKKGHHKNSLVSTESSFWLIAHQLINYFHESKIISTIKGSIINNTPAI